MNRFTIKQLQESSDNLLTRSILNERINGLTNPYSPLSERLQRLVRDIKDHLPATFAPKEDRIKEMTALLKEVEHDAFNPNFKGYRITPDLAKRIRDFIRSTK